MSTPDSGRPQDPAVDPRYWRDVLLQHALDSATDGVWGPIAVLPSTGSTNADAADQVREGAPEGFTIVADEQTTGRGRLGRTWESPSGAGLAMSVVLRPVAPEQSWGWLPLLAGVAVADALMAQGVPAALKWPNDVVVDGPARDGSPGPRKLGGLLAERVENAIVVGIGINVDLREDELPVGRATSTWLEGSHVTRESLVVDILENLRKRYATWQGAVGDAARCGLATDYSERCVTVGREVRAHVPGDRFVEGTATHIDEHGRLVIRLADGSTHAMSAGDVEHLR